MALSKIYVQSHEIVKKNNIYSIKRFKDLIISRITSNSNSKKLASITLGRNMDLKECVYKTCYETVYWPLIALHVRDRIKGMH